MILSFIVAFLIITLVTLITLLYTKPSFLLKTDDANNSTLNITLVIILSVVNGFIGGIMSSMLLK